MLTRASVLLVVFMAGAAAIARLSAVEPQPVRAALSTLPIEIGGWHGREDSPFDAETLAVLGVDDYLTRTYANADAAVGVYIGYWASQRQGDTIHSPLNCLPGAGWEPLSRSYLSLRVPDGTSPGRDISINRYLVEQYGNRELVLYWYQQRGRVVASEYLTRMFQVTDAIRLHRNDGAIVRLMIAAGAADADLRAAERAGVGFAAALFPWLEHSLPS